MYFLRFKRTMCIVNSRKSWLSLIISSSSLLNKDSHIFFNVVIFLLVKSLEVNLNMLKYSLFNALVKH